MTPNWMELTFAWIQRKGPGPGIQGIQINAFTLKLVLHYVENLMNLRELNYTFRLNVEDSGSNPRFAKGLINKA